MRIFEVVKKRAIAEGKVGGYTYELPDAIPMARQWLDKFSKTGDQRDFFVFMDWVFRFRDDPHLAGVEQPWRGFTKDRDALKIMRGYLDLLMQDYQNRRWQQLQYRYSVLLSMLFQVKYHVFQGWNPREKLHGVIKVQMLDNNVLGIRWAKDPVTGQGPDPKWVEVRGTNYWQWKPDDPLHQLIDRITGNKSDLMIGREIDITPEYEEYPELKRLLSEASEQSSRSRVVAGRR